MKYTIGHMRQFTSIGLIVTCLLSSVSVLGTNLTGKRIYINPGHGSWGSDDRPLATIPYPNLPTSGMPDTLGFYESNTNLWKCMYLGQKLEAAGAKVFYSRTANGPWDYEMVDGDYPTYNAANYLNRSDYHKYNKNLTEISAEVEANNIDYFISVHSNATGIKDGDLRNHPLYIYRGPNDYASANTVNNYEYVPGSYEKAAVSWDYCNEIMLSGINPSTDFKTTKYIVGDQDFYSEPYDSHNQHSWKTYYGYLGALKHGASGFLVEGYFHSYQPARHRALNPDYCAMEGLAYYRGIVDYYDADIETKGYIMGTIKDANNKIEHSLFKYLQGTNDQWLPCNGATVTLYKAGVAIQTYKVDTLYNGIFVFKDLEPGDDYSLDATCPGYAPLANTYKSTFSVKANQTTYQMIYLEETAQPTSVPSIFGMKQSYTNQSVSDLLSNKTIRRTIYGDGMIYILAVDANKQPTLLAVNTDTQNATTLPTNLCTVTSNNGYKLSDIALTEDGVLIGCNMENVKSSPTNNWTLYKWIKTASGWQQEIWFSHAIAATAGNWESAMTGGSIAYKGSTKHGRLITTAISTYTPYKIRMAIYDIAGGQVHKVWYNKFSDETNTNTNTYGEALQLDVSPRERDTYIFSSPKKNAFEWQINTTSAGTITTTATMPFHTYNASYFTYANKEMMAIADTDPQGKNIGIKLYDISTISNTTIQPILVKTTNTTLNATTPVYVSSMGYAYNKDITLYLLKDNTLSKFTTVNVEQPKIPHIEAYNLNTINQGGNYTFSFYANDNTEDASLIFYDVATGVEVERQPIRVQKGANTYTLAAEDLPGQNGDTFTWAIELNGLAVKDFGLLHTDESLIASSSSRLFNAVNTNPESEKFGYIYVMHQATYTGDGRKNSGVWEYDYTLSKQHDTRYNGNQIFGSPYRMSIDKEGYLYLTDWSDGAHSGIWIANTADLTQPFTPFFVGEHDSNGVIQNNGQCIGSSTSGCFVYGEGKDTKLYVYNEDEKNTLYANSIAIYHIGQEDGTLLHEWHTTPNPTYVLKNQSGSNANVWVTSKGFFICQVREAGMNNSTAPSLQFYSYDGRCRLSSDNDNYANIIDGSYAGGFAVSLDEKMLILNDGSQNFLLFNITWDDNTPTLELQTKFHHGISAIRQMNWDYAGNLICSGDEGIHIFTVPTNKNQTIIPARKALTVTHQTGFTYVTSITLNSDRSLIKIGSKDTLTAVVSPAHATNKSIVWESKDNAIATVDNGIVTGVAKGETTIYAKTNDGSNLVDSCYVRVYGYMDEADACRIWAYDLNLSNEGNAYTFEFKSTTYAIAAYLIFLDEEEKEISRYALNRVEKGLNTFTLDIHDIVQTDNVIRWAVELHSEPIQDIVEITSNEDKYYYYLAQDVAVNTNPYSKHFGKMYVLETYAGASDGISAHSQTQTPGIYVYDPALNLENYAEGYLPSNVTLNTTTVANKKYRELHRMAINPVKDELAFVQSTAVKVWVASLDNLEAEATNVLAETGIKASSLCYDENGTLYVLDPFAATATIYKQVDGEFVKFVERNNWGWTDDRNAMESDGRGGLWVVQNIADLATNEDSEDMLTHINAAGEVDFYVNKTSSAELQALMPAASNRGQIGYDAKHDILALGGKGAVKLFNVTYTEDGPTLSLWQTVTLGGDNVDGLAFDYAGDLIAMSASVERFYKFALPTEENTTTVPAQNYIIDNLPTNNISVSSEDINTIKILHNGMIYIIRNGQMYNIQGIKVK